MKIQGYDKSVNAANKPGTHVIICEVKGLELWISKTKTGLSKTFRLRYRANGTQARVTLGKYPVLTLKEAKDKALDHLRGLQNDNIDPAEKERLGTFKSFYEKWIEKKLETAKDNFKNGVVKRGDQGLKTLSSYESALRLHCKPLHNKHLMDITEEEVTRLIETIKNTKSAALAHKAKNAISTMFNEIIRTSTIIKKNPVTDKCKVSLPDNDEDRGQKPLTNEMIKELDKRLLIIDPIRRGLIKMALYTGMRRNNLEFMKWEDISADFKTWTIPAYLFKGQRAHTVPLSEQAQAILRDMEKIRFKKADKSGRFVFPFRSAKAPEHPSRLQELLETLGMGFTSHAFRKTVYTIMRELRIDIDIVKACVGHQYKQDDLEKTYNRDNIRTRDGKTVIDGLKEMAFQEYADEIERIIQGYYDNLKEGEIKNYMISIVNISKELKETGLQQYAIKINGRTLTTFEHMRENKLSVCLDKAREAVEKMENESK